MLYWNKHERYVIKKVMVKSYNLFLYKIEKEQREKDQEEYSTNIRILTISYCIAPQNQKKRTV